MFGLMVITTLPNVKVIILWLLFADLVISLMGSN